MRSLTPRSIHLSKRECVTICDAEYENIVNTECKKCGQRGRRPEAGRLCLLRAGGCWLALRLARVERVPQPIADEVDR